MPRIPRGLVGGGVAHVLNRGNAKARVFHSPNDYVEFIKLLREVLTQHEVELFAFCLMPNHFHLVARFENGPELSAMMQQWLTAHVSRHAKRHESTGHIWQGRYKSFPIQEDQHLFTVLRYVLLNPCRAGLVSEAREWPWSSLHYPDLVSPWPVTPPTDVSGWLSGGDDAENERVRESIQRGSPFGSDVWRDEIAKRGGLEGTLRSRGRPKAA